jgi:hypothetical protein
MMDEGVRRMDQLFTAAFQAGALQRDSTLNLPPPPPPPVEEPVQVQRPAVSYQVGIAAPNAATYNSALAHLRAVPGVTAVQQVNIALGDISYLYVTYRGELGTLRSILVSRGWGVDVVGGGLRMYVPRPAPATPAPAAQPQAQPSNSVQPQVQNRTGAAAVPPQTQAPGT